MKNETLGSVENSMFFSTISLILNDYSEFFDPPFFNGVGIVYKIENHRNTL